MYGVLRMDSQTNNRSDGAGRTDSIPCGEAPYSGTSRIRFEGTLSAGNYRHPRFKVAI